MSEEIDLTEEANPDSFFYNFCPPCDECGRHMDHPPIILHNTPAVIKSKGEMKPYAETGYVKVCRFCLLDAVAPLSEPPAENSRLGWWWRKIINGEIEPIGTRKKKRDNRESIANPD